MSKNRRKVLPLAAMFLVGTSAIGVAENVERSRIVALPVELDLEPGRALPEPSGLEVVFDDRSQEIRKIERQGERTAGATGEPLWGVEVYFDAPLTTPEGLRAAARSLARQAERLVGLGPTQIVLADPLPRLYLQESRDAIAIQEALRDLANETMTAGEIEWLRLRFISRPEAIDHEITAPAALRREADLLEQQREGLLRWLSRRETSAPRLLVLVQNGHDLNPRAFYSRQAGDSFLEDPRAELSHADLTRNVAGDGWTVMAVALGRHPNGFVDPLAPLFELVEATGGELATSRRQIPDILDRLASRMILFVEIRGPADAEPRPLEVRHPEAGGRLKATRWASVMRPMAIFERLLEGSPSGSESRTPRPVLKLLRPQGLALTGPTTFHTVSGRKRIHRVAFLIDGDEVAEDLQAPFSSTIDLGPVPRPRTVTAVAYSKTGGKLGEDSIALNSAVRPPHIEITDIDYREKPGILGVAASVTSSPGYSPFRVDFFLNQLLAATAATSPFRVEIPAQDLGPRDFVRVVAHYRDGVTVEAARLAVGGGAEEEVTVNMVELLTTVTPRPGAAGQQLEKEDFVIRHQGRALAVRHFARWDDLPLTLGLVIDTSDSMDSLIEDAREAGERFLKRAVRPHDRAFMVDFNTLPRLAQRITEDSTPLQHHLESLRARGETALYDAIVFSLLQFDGTSGRRALVVFTDGEDSASRYQPRQCVQQARLNGVPIFLITLGPPPDPSRQPHLLRNQMIARRSGGAVYYVTDPDDLDRIFAQVGTELRRQYLLTFTATRSLSPQELQEIEVEVMRKGMTVRTLLASQQRGG